MILATAPPAYFPPPAACAKLAAADVVVSAESFRFSRKEGTHRTAIRTMTGRRWLSVPVVGSGWPGTRISDLAIDFNQPWADEHWRVLEYNYHNAAYFYYYAEAVERIIRGAGQSLVGLLADAGQFVRGSLALRARVISSSLLPEVAERTGRLLAWAEACGCDRYLIHPGEAGLLDLPRLEAAGIGLDRIEFTEAPYHQQGPGFLPGLSLLDLLFNEGPAAAGYLQANIRIVPAD